jgi:NusB family
MAARSKARKRAVDVLYAADLRGRSRADQLAEEVAAGNPAVPEHTVRLVEGVAEHARRIDELIDRHASGDDSPAFVKGVLAVILTPRCPPPDRGAVGLSPPAQRGSAVKPTVSAVTSVHLSVSEPAVTVWPGTQETS